jgi:hypothetical protein
VAGKLEGQCVGAVPTADGPHALLFYLVDAVSGTRNLGDSGAAFSVLPHHSLEPPRGPALRGADGSRIRCWGLTQTAVVAQGRRFVWNFLQAAVAFPILGSDFFIFFKMVLDLECCVLSNRKKTWKCSLSAPVVAAEFLVVGLVGLFDQEWPDNSHFEGTEHSAMVAAAGQPSLQE